MIQVRTFAQQSRFYANGYCASGEREWIWCLVSTSGSRTLLLRFTAHELLRRNTGSLDRFKDLPLEREHAQLNGHEAIIAAIGNDNALRLATNRDNNWLSHIQSLHSNSHRRERANSSM